MYVWMRIARGVCVCDIPPLPRAPHRAAGALNGRGASRHAAGDAYDGEFAAARRHGAGTLRAAGGRVVYRGAWEDGERHGRGREEGPGPGEVYDGEWRAGVRAGEGRHCGGPDGDYQG